MPLRINVPPLTRFLLILLLLVSAVYQFRHFKYRGHPIEADAWFVLTIPRFIYHPWVLITATFAERNIVTLLIAGASILGGGRYLERAWGSAEFGKFSAVVVLGPNVAALLIYITVFAFIRSFSAAYVWVDIPVISGVDDSAVGLPYMALLLYKPPSLWPLNSLSQNTRSPS